MTDCHIVRWNLCQAQPFSISRRKNAISCCAAAREEFSRAPYADASINRIIREAGIPRGSFYMYFRDKQELLLFLLSEYTCRLADLLEGALRAHGGDLLSAFLAFFDTVSREYSQPHPNDAFRPLVSILRLNAGLHSKVFETAASPKVLLDRLTPCIDKSLLSLQTESDLQDMFSILTGVTGSALCGALQNPDSDEARAQYVNHLNILRRGMAARAASCR
jgi:AcrR family transcriptional regulator